MGSILTVIANSRFAAAIELVRESFPVGLCDNRNSHITIMLLDIMIITIVDPLLYVSMKFTKTLLNTPIIFFIICYPLFPELS